MNDHPTGTPRDPGARGPEPARDLPDGVSEGVFSRRIPPGDNRERLICNDCGTVLYENPKIVVGAVVAEGEKVLLCRRAIEPRRGFWTIPAGFMEQRETTEEGAQRETREEARAEIEITGLLAFFDIPRISQLQLIYRSRLVGGEYGVGEESLEVGLFSYDGIPWQEMAFPASAWALRQHFLLPADSDPPRPLHRVLGSMRDFPPDLPAPRIP